ncbi:hypothetical protein EV361DRAFT_874785, partial [Lentinula raphanica]
PLAAITTPPTTETGWCKWAPIVYAVEGVVTATAATAGAAYGRRDDLGVGYIWATDHMKYVRNLWDEDALKRRIDALIEIEKKEPVIFRKSSPWSKMQARDTITQPRVYRQVVNLISPNLELNPAESHANSAGFLKGIFSFADCDASGFTMSSDWLNADDDTMYLYMVMASPFAWRSVCISPSLWSPPSSTCALMLQYEVLTGSTDRTLHGVEPLSWGDENETSCSGRP